MDYIPVTECKHGWLYRIRSRNLDFGIYNEDTRGFIGIREKGYAKYLFTEYHHDEGPPYGTAFSLELLESCPLELQEDSKELFAWLKDAEERYETR